MMYISMLLDLGMLIQCVFAIYMLINAYKPDCADPTTRYLVGSLVLATFFRVCHCIGIALFAVCCIPCYFCTDSCCVKKMLIS